MMAKTWTIVVLATAVTAIATIAAGLFLPSVLWSPPGEGGHTALKATDFLLVDLQGRAFRLSDFRGRIVIIDFMATWCGPCRLQIPHLQEVRERYGDLVTIISISVDPVHDSNEVLKEYLKEYPHADWIWARDTINLKQIYGVVAIPTLVVIDQEGYVRFKHVGLTPSSTIIQEIDEILRRG